jgi:hypothetical protein
MGGPIYHDVATKSYRDALGNTLATKMDRLNQNPNWQAIKDRVWTGETPSSVQYKWARVDVIDAPPEPLDRLKPARNPASTASAAAPDDANPLGSPGGIRQRDLLEHAMRYGHRIPLEDMHGRRLQDRLLRLDKVDDPSRSCRPKTSPAE